MVSTKIKAQTEKEIFPTPPRPIKIHPRLKGSLGWLGWICAVIQALLEFIG